MRDPKHTFDFTALPKCQVTDRPTPTDIEYAKKNGRMVFVIIKGEPPADVDTFVDGFLAGCEVERSEYMVIFFNDTDLKSEDARLKFSEKYRNLRFPDRISGNTSLATKAKGNRLSNFLCIPVKGNTVQLSGGAV